MKFYSRLARWLISPCVLRNSILAAATLITLIALFYAVENWRGARAWNEVVAYRQSHGIPTDRHQIIPQRPPDAENFCILPVFQNGFSLKDEEKIVPETSQSKNRFPGFGNLSANRYPSFAEIAAYYRKEPVFPQAPLTASDPEVILTALDKYQNQRQQLVQALPRPASLFPVDFNTDAPWTITLPHIGQVMNISRTLDLHALASLAAGKNQEALDDIRIQFRMSEALSQEPLLISHLVTATITAFSVQPIWYGLAENKWSDTQLQALGKLLRSSDLLTSGQKSMRGEEILFFESMMDHLKKAPVSDFQGFMYGEQNSQGLLDTIAAYIFRIMPDGWYDQSKVIACPMYEDYLINPVDPKNHRIDVSKLLSGDEDVKQAMAAKRIYGWQISPTYIFLGMAFPAASNAWQKIVQAQCLTDMGLIACELELYRLKNGSYPAALSSLDPSLPHDPITGESYHYLRTPNGRYQLWSVGWNQSDEGGTIAYKDKEKKSPDSNQGDWVWAYP